MMSDRPPRKSAGTPQGGRFAGVKRPESDLKLESSEARSWPVVTDEEREWKPKHPLPPASGRVIAASKGPYRAAVLQPIAAIPDIDLPSDVSVDAGEAAVEIARFDGELSSEIAPFATILLRSESAASSKIEQLTASVKAIALAELGAKDRNNAAIIVSNTQAMRAAIELADRLDADTILTMHNTLLGTEHPEWAGKWRDEQVWIGGSDYSPHLAKFVPPHHDRVLAAIGDLVKFMARNDLPPFVQAAVAHAQFETIHPFPDGNGRVGRALVHSLLRGKRLTRNVTVPVSAGLLTNTDTYFEALTAYRAGDPAPIVQRFSDAAFSAIGNGRELVGDLRELRRSWGDSIRARSDAAAWRLADLVIRQPIVDSPLVQRELGLSAQNTNIAIERLAEAGVLHELSGNARNRRWEAREVLQALEDFAKRSGRRG